MREELIVLWPLPLLSSETQGRVPAMEAVNISGHASASNMTTSEVCMTAAALASARRQVRDIFAKGQCCASPVVATIAVPNEFAGAQ